MLDYPYKEGMAPEDARRHEWLELPELPDTKGDDPMCIDRALDAVGCGIAHARPLRIDQVGIGYMLAPGRQGQQHDPYAMQETAENHWVHAGPHLMIVVPNTKALAGMPTNPAGGGPWVMFPNTPYTHIMAPTTAGDMKREMKR